MYVNPYDIQIGEAEGTVAAGNDSRIVGAVQAAGGILTGPLRPTIVDGLTGTGVDQASALLITAQHVVISNATGGFRLPAAEDVGGILAPVNIRNKDTVNAATIYPPEGGSIDALGENSPLSVPSGGQITILPGTTSGQWWA
jgi:hypothetical protein